MGYLEIIGIGYAVNILAYVFIILISILNVIVNMLYGNAIDLMAESTVLKTLHAEYYELKKLVPKNISGTPEDKALFFPFMLLVPTFKLFFFSMKYGMNNYLALRIIKKNTEMKEWIKANEK